MEPLSIETRKDDKGNVRPPELVSLYDGWTILAFEQHGQVKLKGRASPQFHYMTTVIATRDDTERKAITCLGTAQQVTVGMLQQLGAPLEEARSIAQRAEELAAIEAKRIRAEEAAEWRRKQDEDRAKAEADRAAASPKGKSKGKPRLTEEERAARQVETDQRAKDARQSATRSKEERAAELEAARKARDEYRARYSYRNPDTIGTWAVEAGPIWSVPEIPDVYSADRIGGGNSHNSIPAVKATLMFGELHTIVSTGGGSAVTWKLMPSLDYRGKAMTYSQHSSLPDTNLYRYGYEGVLVYHKQQEYCMTQPVMLRKFWGTPAKEWPVVPELVTRQTEVERHVEQELALARQVREEGNIRTVPSEEANHRREPRRRPARKAA